MHRRNTLRGTLAALALVAILEPVPALALEDAAAGDGTPVTDSIAGALMSVACGAGLNVCRYAPLPIVVTVTIASCALMMLDAWSTPDA